eukprot:TRINITY_DN2508_c0_g1_i3.p1 TRINITY_DN2508_c0_g1~~TRINITY_DN2508_c0_g1_i3.p1  ORF type:complete len:242 (-),score=47.73 TRINITY_DN2508_c0_g1_i3:51-776(-)
MPADIAVHVSNGAELMLLITLIYLEDKLSGEIQEVRLLDKMIKIRQVETRISDKLAQRYPAPEFNRITPTPHVEIDSSDSKATSLSTSRANDVLAQSSGPQSLHRKVLQTSLHRQPTSMINAQGFLAPSQMLGFGEEVHDSNMRDHRGQPFYDSSSYGNVLLMSSGSERVSSRVSSSRRSARDDILKATVLQSLQPSAEEPPEKPFTVKPNAIGGSMHLKPAKSATPAARKRPGHARKHSF